MNSLFAITARSGQGLGSFTARYQSAVLHWAWGGLLHLALAYALGEVLQHLDWVTYHFNDTVLWCLPAYAVAVQWLYLGAHLPHFERVSYLVMSTSVPFALLPLGFALAQHPYSRSAVLLVWALCTAYFLLGYYRIHHSDVLHLAYLDAPVPEQLQQRITSPALEALPLVLHPWLWQEGVLVPPVCDGVVLDPQTPYNAQRQHCISQLKQAHVRLYSVDSVAELLTGRRMLPHPEALWEQDARPAYDAAKRMSDIALVLLALPLWLPLCLCVGLLIRLDSPGPVLFSQPRTGQNGRPFRLWKLRSMHCSVDDADSIRPAQAGDTRITRVGRWIRRTRIDELPQLWNVLRGDMALIGPRPEQAHFVQSFAQRIPAYPYRHLVRPGLTGWAQVQQGYTDSEAQTAVKLSYDLYYVAHYCLALDLLIAYKTVRIVLTGFGAR